MMGTRLWRAAFPALALCVAAILVAVRVYRWSGESFALQQLPAARAQFGHSSSGGVQRQLRVQVTEGGKALTSQLASGIWELSRRPRSVRKQVPANKLAVEDSSHLPLLERKLIFDW